MSAGTLHWQFCAPTIKTVLLPHYYIIMNLYRYFIEGSCWYGDSCFYAHDMNCRFFLAGNCRNGSSCRFIHGNNNAPTPPPFGTKSEQREVTRTFSNSQDDQKSPREKSKGVARVPCVVGVGRKEILNKRTCVVPSNDDTKNKHCKLCCIRKSSIEVQLDNDHYRPVRNPRWRVRALRSVSFKCHDEYGSRRDKPETEYSDDEYKGKDDDFDRYWYDGANAVSFDREIGGLVKAFTGKEWKWIWWSPEHSIPLSRRVAGARAVAEAQAISLAIAQAVQSNTKQIQVETDSQFVLDAVSDWLAGMDEAGDGGNPNNKSIFSEKKVDLVEDPQKHPNLQNLLQTAAAANLEIQWNHVLGSANNEAIQQAEKLEKRKNLNKRLELYSVAGLGDDLKIRYESDYEIDESESSEDDNGEDVEYSFPSRHSEEINENNIKTRKLDESRQFKSSPDSCALCAVDNYSMDMAFGHDLALLVVKVLGCEADGIYKCRQCNVCECKKCKPHHLNSSKTRRDYVKHILKKHKNLLKKLLISQTIFPLCAEHGRGKPGERMLDEHLDVLCLDCVDGDCSDFKPRRPREVCDELSSRSCYGKPWYFMCCGD